MNTCPCCGQSVADLDRVVVDLNTNTLSHGGATVRVPAKCAELAFALAESWPRTMAFERLMVRVWGDTSDGIAMSTLRVYALLLRRAVKPLGMDVLGVKGVGYRFGFNVEGKDECRTTECI